MLKAISMSLVLCRITHFREESELYGQCSWTQFQYLAFLFEKGSIAGSTINLRLRIPLPVRADNTGLGGPLG